MGEQRPREEGLAQSAWEVFHLEAHWSWFAYLRLGITKDYRCVCLFIAMLDDHMYI